MRVVSLDLKAQHARIRDEIKRAIETVVDSQRFILGPEVESFEKALASYCGTAHAVGVSSGTDALLISLMAIGVGPGHEVVTTPYSFFATAGAIARLGARPVFVDIEPDTFNMKPEAVKRAIGPKTRAVILVHLFGQCADLPDTGDVPIIEDAAQAIGARVGERRAGSLGRLGCFSFFPSKNLGGFGDGGAVTTNDAALAEKLRALRAHGSTTRYHHPIIGGNFRLDALQAAVLNVKIKYLDRWIDERRAHAHAYTETLRGVTTPREKYFHTYNQYVIRSRSRDALRAALKAAEIDSAVYYPLPFHLQPCFSDLGYREGAFPEAERASQDSLALPIYPELPPEARRAVAEIVGATGV